MLPLRVFVLINGLFSFSNSLDLSGSVCCMDEFLFFLLRDLFTLRLESFDLSSVLIGDLIEDLTEFFLLNWLDLAVDSFGVGT